MTKYLKLGLHISPLPLNFHIMSMGVYTYAFSMSSDNILHWTVLIHYFIKSSKMEETIF